MISLPITLKKTFIIFMLLFGINELASAQGFGQWSPPNKIPGFSDSVWTPYIVADQNQTVHAFVSDWVGEEDKVELGILYSRWTRRTGWTESIDIILPARGDARVKGVYLDQFGSFHLIFFEGDDFEGTINYTSARVPDAAKASSWSDPVTIGRAAITPDEAAVVGDDRGNLYVIYAGRQNSHGFYLIHSNDSGITWTEPSPIFLTHRYDLWPTALKLDLANSGDLHAVWALGALSGNSLAVYYRRLDTDQMVWADTVQLAVTTIREVDTPSIIEHEDELVVIYHADSPTTRHMLRSFDGGQTWTDPIRLFPHVGSNGAAALIVDGNNDLHMFFGNRVGTPIIHGMWHSVWLENRWSDPEAIASGPLAPGFDPARPRSVLSQGNTILVVWQTEPGQIVKGTSNGAEFSYLVTDAPELPLAPFKTDVVNQVNQPAAEAVSVTLTPTQSERTPTAETLISSVIEPETDQTNPGSVIILGLIPAFILCFGILILNRFRH